MTFDPPYLIVTATHDYRTKRRVDLHFIADELSRLGETMFLATHSSPLSTWRGRDQRHELRDAPSPAGSAVQSHLWYSVLHPVNVRPAGLAAWNAVASAVYARTMPRPVDAMVRRARTIIVESGSAVALIPEIARRNPDARIIYSASDTLRTIGMARFYEHVLEKAAPLIDYARLPSARMATDHACIARHRIIPHGLAETFFTERPDPYAGRAAAVSVGSMLFDPNVFDVAAKAFPHIDFHVIGSGHDGQDRDNLHWISEMGFEDTIPYIQHARFGIAPYRSASMAGYLVDTSMKLMQFAAIGLPAICPDFAQGGHPLRFGYTVGDDASLVHAIERTLACERRWPDQPRTWRQVTAEMVAPLDDAAR
jgi:2-beta-glucuronyltransferase